MRKVIGQQLLLIEKFSIVKRKFYVFGRYGKIIIIDFK